GMLGPLGGIFLRWAATESVATVTDEPSVDCLGLHSPMNDRRIRPLDFVPGKHADQPLLRFRRPGEDHQAAGIAVEAVDGTHSKALVDRGFTTRTSRTG